jgi:alpha-tubulin suppressor-like RCC1 family protein
MFVATIAALTTIAGGSPAQAAPNVATSWGNNQQGQLGDGTHEGPEKCFEGRACSTAPVLVSGSSGASAVDGGLDYGLALLGSGTALGWGENEFGQLGNGTTKNSDVAVAVSGLSGATAVSAGSTHSLALLGNGSVMAWGANSHGQLGNGSTESSDVPVAVSGLSGVTAISAGGGFSLALLSNGTVDAWGNNANGQLGNGTTESSDVPVAVSGLSGVTAISAGEGHALALLSNGTVMAWGIGFNGQLGNGGTEDSDVPVKVSGLSGVSAVAAGGFHSLALLGNGTVKAWGDNASGQLGDGTSSGPEQCGTIPFSCSRTPVAVSGLSGVTAIAGGGDHSLALLGRGLVLSWGSNSLGQLGVGTSTGPEPCGTKSCSTKPVPVMQSFALIRGISAGADYSLAVGPPPPPAGLPEVGRCVKVPVGTGRYSGGNCVTLAKGELGRKYEWMPVTPTEKPAFSGSGGETTLTTAGHSAIKCIVANLSGEWTGPKTASVSVELEGCLTAGGAQCQTVTNPQTKSEIKLNSVLGELGFIRYEEVEGKLIATVGLDLKPQPPMKELAAYECTGSSETGHIEGSVIGKITPLNKMTTESNVLYLARASGEQRPEFFQGSPTDTLITSFTAGTESKGSGASSLNVKSETGKNAVPLEIKAK